MPQNTSMPGLPCRARRSLPRSAGPSRPPAAHPHGAQPFPLSAFPSAGSGGAQTPRGRHQHLSGGERSPGPSPSSPRARGAPGAAARRRRHSPAAITSRGPKTGPKKVLRGLPRPRKGAKAARRGEPTVPSGTAPSQPPASTASLHPPARHPQRCAPAAPAAALRRSALGRSGPGPALPPPPPAPRTAGLPTATAIAVRCLRCAAARRLCAAC